MSTGFTIVERKDLPEHPRGRPQKREDITALIAAVPFDGKGIAKAYESEKAAVRDSQALRDRIKAESLSLDCFKRGTTLYLFRKETK